MAAKAKILLVDDDTDILASLSIILEKNGYLVKTARNSSEALAALALEIPDLMILDVMMETDTEGFELVNRIKHDHQFTDFPIIILTSFLDRVRKEGPDNFLHIVDEEWQVNWVFEKPVDTKKLLTKIEGLLSKD